MALLDTLISAFKGGERTRVPLSCGMTQGWLPAFDGGLAARSYDYARAVREGFLANPIAQRSVRLLAEGIGQAPLTCPDPRLAALVTATSAGQSLIETLAANLLLNGNAYVQILKDASGKPVELFALRPDRIQVVLDDKGWPCAYDYKVGSHTARLPVEDEDGWPGLIAIRAMHPLDDHRGAGALEAAWQAVLIHNAATHWNRALLPRSPTQACRADHSAPSTPKRHPLAMGRASSVGPAEPAGIGAGIKSRKCHWWRNGNFIWSATARSNHPTRPGNATSHGWNSRLPN